MLALPPFIALILSIAAYYLYYLISAFWAGQEGTFLLWVLLGSIYGLVIIPNRSKDEALVKRNYNTWVKSVYPYALFVGLALGTGIILGGYRAYTTLGR